MVLKKETEELKEKCNKIKKGVSALFFDLDGTLLNEKGEISPLVRAKIEEVKSKGHKMFVNTGRAKGFLPSGMADDPLFSGFICGGAYAEIDGKILFNTVMCEEAKRQIIAFSDNSGVPVMFEGIKENYAYFKEKRDGFINIPQEMSIEEFCTSSIVTPTKATFLRTVDEFDTSVITSAKVIKFRHYAEALSNGCDKKKAMYRLLDEIGIPHECSVAFGDSENDNEMLEGAGIAVAMPMSPESTKENADLICDIVTALEFIYG